LSQNTTSTIKATNKAQARTPASSHKINASYLLSKKLDVKLQDHPLRTITKQILGTKILTKTGVY
jgi:hypothetical protein